jgi:hypothetical protein
MQSTETRAVSCWQYARHISFGIVLRSALTAKANGLTPFDYLHHLLEELPKKSQGIEQLLPWNVDLSKNIKR